MVPSNNNFLSFLCNLRHPLLRVFFFALRYLTWSPSAVSRMSCKFQYTMFFVQLDRSPYCSRRPCPRSSEGSPIILPLLSLPDLPLLLLVVPDPPLTPVIKSTRLPLPLEGLLSFRGLLSLLTNCPASNSDWRAFPATDPPPCYPLSRCIFYLYCLLGWHFLLWCAPELNIQCFFTGSLSITWYTSYITVWCGMPGRAFFHFISMGNSQGAIRGRSS